MHLLRMAILYILNLTATVDGEAGDEEETFIILGQEEYGAEFDEKLTRRFCWGSA